MYINCFRLKIWLLRNRHIKYNITLFRTQSAQRGKDAFGIRLSRRRRLPPSHSIMSAQFNTCQTFTENGNNCCVCQLWNCKDCIIFKEEYDSNISNYFCEMCNRNQNPESRATCGVCELTDNIEEGADCHKCHHWTCSECVLFCDDGNYFCQECAK